MKKELIIYVDGFEESSRETHYVDDVCAYLYERFAKFPDNAKLFHKSVSLETDVTPKTEAQIEALQKLQGRIILILGAGKFFKYIDPALYYILSFLIPKKAKPTTQTPSSNNNLSDRQNSARPNERIPDIFGEVRATPDMLQVEYRIFVGSVQYAISYMCISRGLVTTEDWREDTTLVNAIYGEALAVYGPGTSPNSGDAPILQIGDDIAQKVSNVKQIDGISGQTLYPPNYNLLNDLAVYYRYEPSDGTYRIHSTDSGRPLTNRFQAGNTLQITDGTFTSGGHSFNPSNPNPNDPINNNAYKIEDVVTGEIILSHPELVNPQWINLQSFAGLKTTNSTPVIDANPNFNGWTAPVAISNTDVGQFINNFFATSGAYYIQGDGDEFAVTVSISVGITPIDADGNQISSERYYSISLVGNFVTKAPVGVTLFTNITATADLSIRAKRTSNTIIDSAGQVVDTTIWQNCYTMDSYQPNDFGNVTTVQSQTTVTPDSVAVQNRKLNCLATRNVYHRLHDDVFSTDLEPTTSADDILVALATDPFIGRSTLDQLDLDTIYDTVAAVKALFGTDACGEFSTTLDDKDMSYEETVTMLTNAIFCVPYRQGSVLEIEFEEQNDTSTVLFGHRNKSPGSENRNSTFGYQNNYDGIELTYADPLNYDAQATVYVPSDMSAQNPNTIKAQGVRDPLQAYFLANRAYNKLRYQNTVTTFDATKQADLLVLTNRILVADNTRPETQDGFIKSISGLTLTLSQFCKFDIADNVYTIFLQHKDGTLEGIAGLPSSRVVQSDGFIHDNLFILATAPRLSLSLGDDKYQAASFVIAIGTDEAPTMPFLVTQTAFNDNSTTKVTASNYDDKYYLNDLDYVAGYIDANGGVTELGQQNGRVVTGTGTPKSESFLDRYLFF